MCHSQRRRGYPYTYTDCNCYSYGHRYCNCYCHGNTDCYTAAHPDTKVKPVAKASPNSATAPLAVCDRLGGK